ncbi:GGDEF domain-containing protein [Dyella psychrodurans]|uniref:GGDEF domain-containing protein n=1 Tax=Dyella psychrodurans TaxID=1927960 RepID=A0A370WW34_9GAMM|nr:GGDEF domain-containing protein [Dyella psychrodurans]RDS80343.1 GGDEF domain-containing protein [Dyella psychrodurans]
MSFMRDTARLTSLLDRASSGLHAVFQPLIRLDTMEIVAHEGLARTAAQLGGITTPELLNLARAEGRLGEFELAAARTVCTAFAAQNARGRLLVNLSAQAFMQESIEPDDLLAALGSGGMDLSRITIELTERDIVDEPARLAHALGYLRAHGVRFALDDFGNGHSNFEMWNEIHPEVVKIDRYLIHGLAKSAERLAIVRALCQVAETLGADLVGEGVEEPDDLRMLRELGICYAQGFLLGYPGPQVSHAISESAREALSHPSISVPPRLRGPVTQRPMHLGHLVIEAPSLTPQQTNHDVITLFAQMPELHALAVVEDERPIGIVNRRVFSERMAQPYTRELYGRKSCTAFMHEAPLLCDVHQSLESMADILRGQDQRYLSDGFVITREGLYLGLGTGESLVRRVTELRIEAARYANPLTFLPGNIPVTEHLARLLRAELPFTVAYVDLNHFKPFNDQYGYFRGDEMIRLLAGILTAQVNPRCDFVGHIGGDDFLLVFQSEDWETRCMQMVALFNQRARDLFAAEDIARQGIVGEDRHGNTQFFPLTTVAIGAVRVVPPFPGRPETLATLAARAKRHAKRAQVGFYLLSGDTSWPAQADTAATPA